MVNFYMKKDNKHKNYEVLNLLGYGLAKFDNEFIYEFDFQTKTAFYNYCVSIKVSDTASTIKNRMDLFDPFFPNKRKGWWQKGNTYIHRKQLIDSLFGDTSVKEYASIVKLFLEKNFDTVNSNTSLKPIIKSRFRQLQETGLESELFFMKNYQNISIFNGGILEDARLYGDGYDFQVNVASGYYLAEVKGIREQKGRFRLTENEYKKALEYKDNYIITVVSNLNDIPKFIVVDDPIKNLKFKEVVIPSRERHEYYLKEDIS